MISVVFSIFPLVQVFQVKLECYVNFLLIKLSINSFDLISILYPYICAVIPQNCNQFFTRFIFKFIN